MRLVVLALAAATLLAADKLEILPAKVTLTGPEARQKLIAEATVGSFQEDWTPQTRWTSSDPKIATVDTSGIVKPLADGEVTITGAAKGGKPVSRFTSRIATAPFTWNFKNHVIPVMTKMGCNQGACHGALAGKNGFKLTLRGYDPDVDYDMLMRTSVGRRVSLTEPATSLVLLKPTFTIPHGGGKRFSPDSLEYRVISEWIAAGAPGPSPNDPDSRAGSFSGLRDAQRGAEQQLVVRAKYSDGRVDDVTRWVKYSFEQRRCGQRGRLGPREDERFG